ncbi:MAG TPA: S-adenosylmethionine:tRNA ribosyltransferase-isomerase [Polyangia bacterium]|nr:S-adenosylmethionine:tRNA ribosyltransferase-isomerase [Polyangia bacterium]
MTPARTYPARRDDVRLLVVDPRAGLFAETRTTALADLLSAGDLLVVNDAATLPASLRGQDARGRAIEIRLLSVADPDSDGGGARFWAALLGAGDWRQRTEDRPAPPELQVGERLRFGELGAQIVARAALSPRLLAVRFDAGDDALWAALYRQARPVQYSYLEHELPLWAVQTVYAARPWAFEMPSAGRPLSWETLLALRRRGVGLAALTHAAGLSATGDPVLDAALPLPERYEIPAVTVHAIADTRARGGRVIAVGTTVVRALEGAAAAGRLRAGAGTTDLRIGPGFHPRVVDGILSGTHAAGETHFALLTAFADTSLLEGAIAYADQHGFQTHELGDAMLVAPGTLVSCLAAAGSAGPDQNKYIKRTRPLNMVCATRAVPPCRSSRTPLS